MAGAAAAFADAMAIKDPTDAYKERVRLKGEGFLVQGSFRTYWIIQKMHSNHDDNQPFLGDLRDTYRFASSNAQGGTST